MKSGDMFLASRGSGEPPRAGPACGAARAATMRERTTPAQAGNRAAPAREGRCAVPRRTAVVEPPRSPGGAVAPPLRLRAGGRRRRRAPLLDQALDVLLVPLIRRLRQSLLGPHDRIPVVADHVVVARHPEVDRPLVREALGVQLEVLLR